MTKLKTLGKKTKKNLIIISVITLVLLSYWAAPVYSLENVSTEAENVPDTGCETVLLYDAKSGQVIYEKEGDVQRTPASITKIMTAIIVLEHLDLDSKVTVPAEAAGINGSNMDLKEGEVLTVEQLLNGMLICSANDAAIALAIEVAGSEAAFIDLMNEKAKDLGANHTNFISVNGYTESYNNTTTAEDLVLIVNQALKSDTFRSIVKKSKYTIPATNLSDKRIIKTTNKLLSDKKTKINVDGEVRTPKYDGAFGIKTGMMLSSGYCLVAGAKRGDTELVAICLKNDNSNVRFQDAIALFGYGFENYYTYELLAANGETGKVKVKNGHYTRVETTAPSGAYVTLSKSGNEDDTKAAEENTSYKINLDNDVEAPIKKGTVVGSIEIYDGKTLVGTQDVVISKDVEKGGPWSKYYISDRAMYISIGLLICFILLIPITIRKRRGKRKHRKGLKTGKH